MKYALVSAINLAILLVGIAIGIVLSPHLEKPVAAQAPVATQTPAPPTSGATKKVEPQMSAGTVGVYLFLAHHIQSDELVVNGIDLLKLHQGEVNLLQKFVPASDINKIITDAKVSESDLYQVVTPGQSTPAPGQTTTPK